MDLVFSYLAGLLTLINPCVLPVLPIVLATALQAHRLGPLALAAGLSLAFVTLGVGIAAAGRSLGLSVETVAQAAALLMIGFGLILLLPQLNTRFATAAGGFASRADTHIDSLNYQSLSGQFLGGALLGAVWSPCIGPTLGGAVSLASQGQNLGWAAAVMAAFAAGVSTVILTLGYGARAALQKRRSLMRRIALRAKPIMGIVFVTVGAMLLFGLNQPVEIWLIKVLPIWLQDLSVKF